MDKWSGQYVIEHNILKLIKNIIWKLKILRDNDATEIKDIILLLKLLIFKVKNNI